MADISDITTANSRDHIDLTTLREVQRLLSSTEFASIEDLAQRTGLSPLAPSQGAGASRPADAPTSSSDSSNPLPKRH